ncbi:MAG: AIR synthase family protein [Candidatus Brockarchaeota archaeon]|nr:AIR synthase family protein [Candidatus Brockarchaeota archaeon]
MSRMLGKVPPRILERIVFSNLGATSRRVIVGPGIGVDNSVISLDGVKIVVSSDPVTGARENLGRIGVDVSTNDVALTGARPEFLLVVLILPPAASNKEVRRIMRQASGEAERLGVAIVGGHTEYSSIVENPVFVGTAIGWTRRRRIITSSGAKSGENIVIVGEAGVEGTSILASDLWGRLVEKGVEPSVLKRARRLVENLSIVEPALVSAKYVSAMHDPTEGGVLGGIFEICEASGKGCVVNMESIPVRMETRIICEKLGLDPLRLVSSGTLLATVSESKTPVLLRRLREKGFKARVIGRMTGNKSERIGLLGRREIRIRELPQDELWKAIG